MPQVLDWVKDNYDTISTLGHLALDGLGMVPSFGAIAGGLPVELLRLGQVLMEMTPSKRLFYWRGELARRKMQQAF